MDVSFRCQQTVTTYVHAVLIITVFVATLGSTKMTGEPSIRCDTNGVSVSVPMDKPFKGHIFVRGHYGDERCHKDYRKLNDTMAQLDISFDECGMRRKRQTNPRGLSVSSTLIVSFHPTFITFGDRAYQVECFYMEENHVVQSDVNVSPLRPTEMVFQPAMPVCKYEVLANGPHGSRVASLNLGDPVYHSWECKSEKKGFYCMNLHSCTADDGEGSMQQIVDSQGCTLDDEIFPQIVYTGDLAAGALMKAFKFADHANVFFQCQIGLSLKDKYEDGKCARPKCSNRAKRSVVNTGEVTDVVAHPILVNDMNLMHPLVDVTLPQSVNIRRMCADIWLLAYGTLATCFLLFLIADVCIRGLNFWKIRSQQSMSKNPRNLVMDKL